MKRLTLVFTASILALCVYAFVAGCATAPATPQQAIFQVKQDYADALSAAVLYDSLPPCTIAGAGVVCSDPAIKFKLKQAKDVASPAIQAAENAVRDPSFDKSTSDAVVAAARQAVIALTKIIATIPVVPAKSVSLQMMAAPHVAAVPILFVLTLLNQLLALLPAGAALAQKFQTQKTLLEQMVAEGREPTEAEWATLDAEVNALEAQVDAGAQP